MKSAVTATLYLGSTPRGAITLTVVKGGLVPAWAVKDHRDQLVNAGVIEAAKPSREKTDANRKPKH